jgi:hypothetical protein
MPSKDHFVKTKNWWKCRGLKWETEEEIEGIYGLLITTEHCENCNKKFNNSKDRCMDHCHQTGKFRNILCQSCNLRHPTNKKQPNKVSHYINKRIKKNNYTYYRFRINRKDLKIQKWFKTLQEAEEYRDNYFKNNNLV